jgi:Cu+-exporting ATPase
MSVAPESIEIPVEGMTCNHCVGTVRRALESVPGVRSAAVDLEAKRAEVEPEPGASLDLGRLRAAVEAVGYRVPDGAVVATDAPPANLVTIGAPTTEPEPEPEPAPTTEPRPEEWNLAIGGMHCASCVARVESALGTVPGVKEARVNLATERASLLVDPDTVREEQLAEAVARAGYSAHRAELDPSHGAESLRRERAEHAAYWGRRLAVGVALTIPLAILGLGPMLGLFGHAAWIGWAMFALATPIQVYLGIPFYVGAWKRLKQGTTNMDTLIAIGSTTAYGYSLYELLGGSAHLAHFFMDGVTAGIVASVITMLIVICGVLVGRSSK